MSETPDDTKRCRFCAAKTKEQRDRAIVSVEDSTGAITERFEVCQPCKKTYSEGMRMLVNGILAMNKQPLHIFHESKLIK